ncbi:MAG: DsrE family protein [Clostridium perfringens]|nr:DsrE family protein [Clostridium perfringens]
MKILLHVTELDKVETSLGNAKNFLGMDKEAKIEILLNGSAAISLQEKVAKNINIYGNLSELSEKEVDICVCNNSLKRFDIDKEKLCSFVKIVPVGIIEVAKKQEEGYSYAKI